MGRTAKGVIGIRMSKNDEVISLCILNESSLLTATENGFGKRTNIHEFSNQRRGGKGVIAIKTSDRNGKAVAALQVKDDDEIMLISSNGTLTRQNVRDTRIIGRNTQGVQLQNLQEEQRLVGVARIEYIEGED